MEEKIVPHVIELAFGIERILQAVVEHSFRQRDDPYQTTYSSFHLKLLQLKFIYHVKLMHLEQRQEKNMLELMRYEQHLPQQYMEIH